MKWQAITTDDLPILAEWFQDADTCQRLGGILPLDAWYSVVSKNPDYHIWMIRKVDETFGCLILEIIDRVGHLAIIVNPELRGKGYGRRILVELFEQELAAKLDTIIANIWQGHIASQQCFLAAGFEPGTTADADGFVSYTIRPQQLVLEQIRQLAIPSHPN